MNLLDILADLEENEEFHEGRLLVLLGAFAEKKGKPIDGLTKLAKLDFLLRYPVFLERALQARKTKPEKAKVAEHERKSVESSMVRYRYGPWDFRYRRFINLLVAKGLVVVETEGRTIHIGLTKIGIEIAKSLSEDDAYSDLSYRSRLLKKHFDLKPTKLMNFIYDTFPEILTLRLGEEIEP